MKTVLITGGTVNTGLAIARHFAKNGYAVAITGRNAERAAQVATGIAAEFHAPVKGYALELSDVNRIREVVEEVERDFSSLDVLVANAANLGIGCGVLNTNEPDFSSIADVNIKGTFFSCQAAAEVMKRHGGGISRHGCRCRSRRRNGGHKSTCRGG